MAGVADKDIVCADTGKSNVGVAAIAPKGNQILPADCWSDM
jgi:hypothetical protein